MTVVLDDVDIEQKLQEKIAEVAASSGQVEIVGSGSKRFYGESIEAMPLDVSAHCGIIDYDPAELVITLRAGCKLTLVEALLAEQRQMFGFEPPHLSEGATIGGTVATGLAGPRRAYAGSVRDFVLGVKLLDGRGQVLRFGGRVIKNVAGFDVSRLMVGAFGTLGIVLEISIRVVPQPETEVTLAYEHAGVGEHIRWINRLGSQPYPMSASLWHDGRSLLRLSGSEQGVRQASAQLGGEEIDWDWSQAKEQRLEFFNRSKPLSRVSLPPTTPDLFPGQSQMIEWGGAQRWLCGEADIDAVREKVAGAGGSVCAYRHHAPDVPRFHPLAPAMLALQRNIKASFDPARLFNPGKLYAGL